MESGALVLVVDDSATVRRQVSALLTQLGHRAVAVDSCERALEAIQQELPTLVLMDLHMDPVRGDEACQRIKARPEWAHVPVVMLTSADQPHEVMYCWRAAADDFLPKPVTAETLGPKVQAALASSEEGYVGPPSGFGQQVFLAVASPLFKTALGGALEHAGLAVVYARNREETERLVASAPDTLRCGVVDVSMRGGAEVLEAVHRLCAARGLPVIALASSELSLELFARVPALTGRPVLDRATVPMDLILTTVFEAISPTGRSAELRSHERVPFFAIVEFRPPGGPWYTGYSYNISAGGIFVRTLTTVPPATRLELKVRSTGPGGTLECIGTVAWANTFRRKRRFAAQLGMGIRLDRTDPILDQQVANLLRATGALKP